MRSLKERGPGIRCIYCWRFISYKDLEEDKAYNYMIYPDSEFTEETFEAYHIRCKDES